MLWFKRIDRFALALSLLWSGYFIVIHQYETAIAMFCFWFVNRATFSIIDVFYTFFAGHPLICEAETAPADGMSANAAQSLPAPELQEYVQPARDLAPILLSQHRTRQSALQAAAASERWLEVAAVS